MQWIAAHGLLNVSLFASQSSGLSSLNVVYFTPLFLFTFQICFQFCFSLSLFCVLFFFCSSWSLLLLFFPHFAFNGPFHIMNALARSLLHWILTPEAKAVMFSFKRDFNSWNCNSLRSTLIVEDVDWFLRFPFFLKIMYAFLIDKSAGEQ